MSVLVLRCTQTEGNEEVGFWCRRWGGDSAFPKKFRSARRLDPVHLRFARLVFDSFASLKLSTELI